MSSVVRKSVSLLLFFVIVLSAFSACAENRLSVGTIKTDNKYISAKISAREYHKTSKDSLIQVAQSGNYKLYFDNKSTSVAVYDSTADFYWTALPAFEGDIGAMLSITVLSEQGKYFLNSQDNSVAFSSYSAEFFDDGLKITYNMSDNIATASKKSENLSENELLVSVPLEIRMKDGNMYVSVCNRDVFVSQGYVLDTVSVLPSFGALAYSDTAKSAELMFSEKTSDSPPEGSQAESEVPNSDENNSAEKGEQAENNSSDDNPGEKTNEYNDFMFLPDGCGAVLYTEPNESGNENLTFKVYSNDDLTDTQTTPLPAFGVKKANCAFVAVLGKNAENATVKANRAFVDSDGANRVCADFKLNATAFSGTDTCYASVNTNSSDICYRFLSGKEADYMGMAAACREQLIREGRLPSGLTEYSELPLNISVICTVNGGYSSKVSDFEGAEDALAVLKGKGINSVNMILQGAFSGGLLQNSSDKADPLKKSGGKTAFDSMCEYAGKQQFKVFAGLNILSASSKAHTAVSLCNGKITRVLNNPLAPYTGQKAYEIKVLAADKIQESVISLLNSAKKLNVSGYCINDGAKFVYADYSGKTTDCVSVSETVSDNLSAFSVHRDLMLDGCNFNALKDASFLLNVPLRTQNQESDSYRAVPFIPAVLHASIGYSGIASNTAAVPKLEMLKTVEYGGIPFCMWTFGSDSRLYYQKSLTEITDFTLRAAKELSDLSSARMTGHRVIQNGLFVTEYDTGSRIYVNYNNFSVPIGNITVPPYDYLRIN